MKRAPTYLLTAASIFSRSLFSPTASRYGKASPFSPPQPNFISLPVIPFEGPHLNGSGLTLTGRGCRRIYQCALSSIFYLAAHRGVPLPLLHLLSYVSKTAGEIYIYIISVFFFLQHICFCQSGCRRLRPSPLAASPAQIFTRPSVHPSSNAVCEQSISFSSFFFFIKLAPLPHFYAPSSTFLSHLLQAEQGRSGRSRCSLACQHLLPVFLLNHYPLIRLTALNSPKLVVLHCGPKCAAGRPGNKKGMPPPPPPLNMERKTQRICTGYSRAGHGKSDANNLWVPRSARIRPPQLGFLPTSVQI